MRTMSSAYDPVALLAKAQAWRLAAKTAPSQWHDYYLGIAEHYEADVRRSMEVPPVVGTDSEPMAPGAPAMTVNAHYQPRAEG
jgi:hypothetical protein